MSKTADITRMRHEILQKRLYDRTGDWLDIDEVSKLENDWGVICRSAKYLAPHEIANWVENYDMRIAMAIHVPPEFHYLLGSHVIRRHTIGDEDSFYDSDALEEMGRGTLLYACLEKGWLQPVGLELGGEADE